MVDHQTGSHVILRHKNEPHRRIAVPYHSEIAKGTLRAILNETGTSQKCSGCGQVVPKSLSERMHQCSRCGLTLDRDINAARNILKAGLEQSHAETEPLLVTRISKFQSRKREANEFIRG